MKAHQEYSRTAFNFFQTRTSGISATHPVKEAASKKLEEEIDGLFHQVFERNEREAEIQCKEVVNELYRDMIIQSKFASIEEYFTAWNNLEATFFSKVASPKKYEIWVTFTSKKMRDGCLRLERNLNLKKDLEAKQKELDLNRLKTLVTMKEEDDQNHVEYEKQIDHLNEQIFSLQKRE